MYMELKRVKTAHHSRSTQLEPRHCHFLQVFSMPATPIIIMMQSEECDMWRIVYSKYKLTATRKEAVLGGYTYTCGTTLAHLQLTGRLADVCVRVLNC